MNHKGYIPKRSDQSPTSVNTFANKTTKDYLKKNNSHSTYNKPLEKSKAQGIKLLPCKVIKISPPKPSNKIDKKKIFNEPSIQELLESDENGKVEFI